MRDVWLLVVYDVFGCCRLCVVCVIRLLFVVLLFVVRCSVPSCYVLIVSASRLRVYFLVVRCALFVVCLLKCCVFLGVCYGSLFFAC